MILDHLDNWRRYATLHPRFEGALAFLERRDLVDLSPGRHPIEGERLYALVIKEDGRGRDRARLEIHRRYIDIQCTIAGADDIGWKPAAQCAREDQEYGPNGTYRCWEDYYYREDPVLYRHVSPYG